MSRLSARWGSLSQRAKVAVAAGAAVAVVAVIGIVVMVLPGSRVSLETDSAVTETIGSEGGSITATSNSGVTYEFVVSPLTLESDVEITVTPITAIEGLPFSGGLIGGVDFKPSGLELGPGATLTIKPVDEITLEPAQRLVGFTTDDAGNDLAVQPAAPVGDDFAIFIEHFTTGGLGLAEVSDLTTAPRAALAESIHVGRLRDLLLASFGTDQQIFDEYIAIFREWRAEIEPLINQAQTGTDAKVALELFLAWEETLTSYEDAALSAALEPDLDELASSTEEALQRGIDDLNATCIEIRSLLHARNVLFLQQYAEVFSPSLTGIGSGLSQQAVLATLCIGVVQSFARLPDPFEPNESVALDLTYGVKFGTDTTLDGAFFDVTLTVSGAFNDGTSVIQTNAGGQLPQTLIATDTTPITIEIKACLAPTQLNASTPLIGLGVVCHFSTLTTSPQGGEAQLEELERESELDIRAGEDTTDRDDEFRDFFDIGTFSTGQLNVTSNGQGLASASGGQTSSVTEGANGGLEVEFSATVQVRAGNNLPIAGDAHGVSSIQVDFTVVDNPVNFTISGTSQLGGSTTESFHRAVQVHLSGTDFAFVEFCNEQECPGPTGTLTFSGVLEPGSYRLEAEAFASVRPHRDGPAQLDANASLSFTFTITGAASAASGTDASLLASARHAYAERW